MVSLYADDCLAVVDVFGFLDEEEMFNMANPPTFGFMMMQMLGMLLLITIFLYLTLYFFRKINAKIKNRNEAICFKIHENIYYSTKQGLSAVSFGNKLYIVGFSQNSVNLIDVIDDAETISKLTEVTQHQRNFTDLMKGYFIKNPSELKQGK